MRRVATVLLLAGSLVGCASSANEPSLSHWRVEQDISPPKRCEPLTADQELVLGLSQEMANERRWHAALANLERLPSDIPQVRLSKARLLRLLGHVDEAQALYGSLLYSCLVADAQHGLGQIEASRRNYPQAQQHLRAAASLSPANETIRNDLGVVYMNQRQLPEARFELLTAMELDGNSRRAAQNMLVLLVYQGNWQGARELVSARGLSSEDFKRAEQRARDMREQDARALTSTKAPDGQLLATPEPAGMAAALASLPTPAAAGPLVRSATAPAGESVAAAASVPVAAPTPAAAPAPVAVPTPAPLRAFVTESASSARNVAPMSLSAAVRAWSGEQATTVAGDMPESIHDAQPAPSAGARPIVCRSTEASTPGLTVMQCQPE
ncbi:tetratricopeptide repeat protein [Pseudomonas sp. MYb185]|uniref:tetratricopeptide repeat protein n=1 Tax=Pseudomonas sp. MYb185 TaxID=1848729 RepID=UPI000CFCE01F|nr:tetratricopeptide repeat protein [Pseudomonas sp. MYb185]PRB83819.1 hypothetical protein CQ007_03010 [Pseudomonas sp. MYb185]